MPLFALTGASGTGKSTAVAELADGLQDRVVVLEQDLLWIPELQARPTSTGRSAALGRG